MDKFYSEEKKLDFSDVLIVPRGGKPQYNWRRCAPPFIPSSVNSRREVDIETAYIIKTKSGNFVNIIGTPVVASNISTIGTIEMAKALEQNNILFCLSKFLPNTELYPFFRDLLISRNSIYTMGISKDDYMKFYRLQNDLPSDRKITKVMIEVANGYIENMAKFVKMFTDSYPDVAVFAGSVCTPEGVDILADAGAHIIRVGIGSGAPCITRVKTGCGYPQLSAIIECSKTARDRKVLILSDGGCQNSGDIVKALVAGANFVMVGSLFAGYNECSHQKNEKGELLYYGMSSDAAQKIHYSEQRDYRGSEGRVVFLEPKGPIQPFLDDVKGGLRSACTYVNTLCIEDLFENGQFIIVNNQYNRLLEK